MTPAGAPFNATLWILLGEQALGCFRVQADSSGRVSAVSVPDFASMDGQTDFNLALRTRIFERYGERCEILVQVDDGAGFETFHRGGLPERSKPPSGPAKQEKLDL